MSFKKSTDIGHTHPASTAQQHTCGLTLQRACHLQHQKLLDERWVLLWKYCSLCAMGSPVVYWTPLDGLHIAIRYGKNSSFDEKFAWLCLISRGYKIPLHHFSIPRKAFWKTCHILPTSNLLKCFRYHLFVGPSQHGLQKKKVKSGPMVDWLKPYLKCDSRNGSQRHSLAISAKCLGTMYLTHSFGTPNQTAISISFFPNFWESSPNLGLSGVSSSFFSAFNFSVSETWEVLRSKSCRDFTNQFASVSFGSLSGWPSMTEALAFVRFLWWEPIPSITKVKVPLEMIFRMANPTALLLESDNNPRPSALMSHHAGNAGHVNQTVAKSFRKCPGKSSLLEPPLQK